MPSADQTIAELFADIGQSFGLSRPAGQCLSAIWRAAQPPCADDLVARLGLSRSNVSTALKELRGAALVGTARAPGDRKDYFTAPANPWELLRLMTAARQRQVAGPLLDRLIRAEADAGAADARLAALHDCLSELHRSLTALSGLDAAGFSRRIRDLDAPAEKPKKKKKKH